MEKQVVPVESFLKYLQPGRCLYIYGGEEHGFPMKPMFVQIVGQHLDSREIEIERENAKRIPDPEKREAALKFFSEPGLKVLAQITPEELISVQPLEIHLKQLKSSRKQFPEFVKRYLELRKQMEVPAFVDSQSSPLEIELVQLHEFIQKTPKNLLGKYMKSDEERYTELRSRGVVLRSKNADCVTDLELEYLQLHRKISKKH